MTKKRLLDGFNPLKELLQFNEDSSELKGGKTDWLLIRGSFLRDILDCLAKSAKGKNEKVKANLLQECGQTVGKNFAAYIIEQKMAPEDIPIILEVLLNQGGWGKVHIEIDPENKSGTITVENSVYTRGGNPLNVRCAFLAGYLQGLIERLFNSKAKCIETQCAAKGAEYCSFNVQITR
jgi:predicted hydrocarbon binding protein